MFLVITGGSGSGKSEYAENRVLELVRESNGFGGAQLYIATMMCFDEESRQRVKRHREMRKGKGFETVECFLHLKNLEIPDSCVILLECMSNLAANEIFDPEGSKDLAAEEILNGIDHLRSHAAHLVVVTNEIFSDEKTYDCETEKYRSHLGRINTQMAAWADEVCEVVYGIPVKIKG